MMIRAGTVMAEWTAARTPRERWLLGIGGVALLIWVGVAVIWQPMAARRDAALRQIALYDRAITTLTTATDTAVTAPVAVTDTRPLNAIVTEAASGSGLTIRRLEPEGDRIRVTIDDAAFEGVVLWLEAMARDSGLRVGQVQMTRRPAPGVVNATLLLTR